MDQIETELKDILKRMPAYEISTVQPKRSKLPYKVWLDDLGERRASGHNNFRLKYGPSYSNCIEIPFFNKREIYSPIGKLKNERLDMKIISKWINLNYDRLIKFYKQDEDYDFIDFMFEMETV